MKWIFSNKNFILLFMGNFVSSIGTTFYNFGVGWYILTITSSPLQAGIYMVTSGVISFLMMPFCVVIADRFDKAKILYVTDYIRGVAIIVARIFIFQALSMTTTLIVLYLSMIVLTVNQALFQPAASSLTVEVVDRENLQSANATMSLIGSFQGIVGLLLGGIIYGLLGIKWIFIINGISFILSGISEMFIRYGYQEPESKLTVKSGMKDFAEGVQYLLSKKGLFSLLY